jgi:hypothetical protein
MNAPDPERLSPNNRDFDAAVLQVAVLSQLAAIFSSPDVKKKFSVTIKDYENGTFRYLPVISIYHPQTKLVILIKIPDLKFLTLYCLDRGQKVIFEQLNFIGPRYADTREIDELLQEREINNDTIADCFTVGKRNLNGLYVDFLKNIENFEEL